MTNKKILLVDDEERLLNSIAQRISLLGFTPLKALSGIEAIEIVKKNRIDLAIVDLKMPDMDGLVTITKLKEIAPGLKTVLLTGYGSEKTKQATEALGSVYIEKDSMAGLWDIIKQSSSEGKVVVIKPSSSSADMKTGSEPSSGRVEIMDPEKYPQESRSKSFGQMPRIIGHTAAIQRLRKNVNRFAEMDCAIVLKGEPGTGRELIARTIHHRSPRRNQRFLAFDCGCFTSDFNFSKLIDSFGGGHGSNMPEKVPFSGTILLDHIENMPAQTQQEMIDLLDGKKDTVNRLMDIRFIVVADQRLEEKVAGGSFQKELFSRIHAIELVVPPLRERKGDIPILIKYFLDQSNQEFGKGIKQFSDEAWQALRSYAFPDNVRELKHMIERSVILTDGDIIGLDSLPERLRSGENGIDEVNDMSFLSIHEMETQHILKVLRMTKGNKSKASEMLGISRAALWRKLKLISEET